MWQCTLTGKTSGRLRALFLTSPSHTTRTRRASNSQRARSQPITTSASSSVPRGAHDAVLIDCDWPPERDGAPYGPPLVLTIAGLPSQVRPPHLIKADDDLCRKEGMTPQNPMHHIDALNGRKIVEGDRDGTNLRRVWRCGVDVSGDPIDRHTRERTENGCRHV